MLGVERFGQLSNFTAAQNSDCQIHTKQIYYYHVLGKSSP